MFFCTIANMSFSVKRLPFYLAFISFTICNLSEAVAIKSSKLLIPRTPPASPLKARQTDASFTPVVGCGSTVDRRGVDDLQTNHADVFNMLLLALQGVQNVAESDDLSWYQISGIHGYPYVPWQEDPDFVPANPDRGYCTHSSAIFTTWHRPYLVLLEQLLCDQARSIAQQFQGVDAARYQAAAEEVRLPYWDWSSTTTQSRIPAAVKQESISVNSPTGQSTIANPLFSYKFLSPQPAASGLGSQTVRSASDDQLAGSFDSRRQSTLNLFTDSAYNQFSNDVENIHNTVHVQVGGNMVYVPRSAFDPIFFLHHANVDRLTAMYQATHPGLTLTSQQRSPTFALGGAGPDDINTLLYPFRHPDRNPWTSNDVATAESIFTYGYSYPEVPQGLSTQALQSFTTQKVNELYAPQSAAPAQARFFAGTQSGVPDSTSRIDRLILMSFWLTVVHSTNRPSRMDSKCTSLEYRIDRFAPHPFLHRRGAVQQ
jgi:tyrosinase